MPWNFSPKADENFQALDNTLMSSGYIYYFFSFFSIQVIQNIELSSLCYTVGPCSLFLYSVLDIYSQQSLE